MQVISVICVGYSDQEPDRRSRRKLKDVMEWYNEQ